MAPGAGVLEAPSEVPPIDGDEVGGGASHRRRRIGPVGAFALVGLLAIGSVFAVGALQQYRGDHLAGSSRTITIRYQCADHISWHQPGSHWRWSVGDGMHQLEVIPSARFDTGTTSDGSAHGLVQHLAHGRIHFDTTTRATFTSDAGRSVILRRMGEPFFETTGCAVNS